MDHTPQQLRKIFLSLPEDLQDAISSVETTESLSNISQKYKLNVNQQADLGSETGLVLLGLTDPMDFAPNLASKLGIDKQTAGNIVIEINDRIFVKVKESLRQIHAGKSVSTNTKTVSYGSNIVKNVETEKLNIPKQTVDILQGKVPEIKNRDTSVLGFQAEKPKQINQLGSVNILEERMKSGFVAPEEKTEKEEQKTIGKPVDPYRELP